jgi:hypothetical protein
LFDALIFLPEHFVCQLISLSLLLVLVDGRLKRAVLCIHLLFVAFFELFNFASVVLVVVVEQLVSVDSVLPHIHANLSGVRIDFRLKYN